MKSWLQKIDIETYSTQNNGNSVVAERFIRTLKKKIYKYMTSISKNLYIDKLGDIVKKYINPYHKNITMKLVDVKSKTYINFDKENNYKDLKIKVGGYVTISKYKNIFAKSMFQIGLKKFLLLKKVKNKHIIETYNRKTG